LGGPQAGLVVGRAGLIGRLARNPLKRALRLDKISLAALEAVLRLYGDPDRLAERLPALRLLARSPGEIARLGQRLLPAIEHALEGIAETSLVDTRGQIGSGASPVSMAPSTALALRPIGGSGVAVEALAQAGRRPACSSHFPRTPAGMPSGRLWSSGSRSVNTTAWSGSPGACSSAYCQSGPPPSGASKPTTSSGPGSRASLSVSCAGAS
jgi:L-seryl-tRNA selenium transferase